MWQNNYVIREAREKDLPQIHAIFNERITNSTCIFAYETVSMESRVAWLNELKGKGYPVIVAAEKASDKAIAYACLNTFRPHPAYVLTSELSLYIDQNHQRQGLGTALLQELLRIGHEMSFHSIIASITADNTASTLLFLKHQFKEIGVARDSGYKFGKFLDVLFMEYIIDSSIKLDDTGIPYYRKFPQNQYVYGQNLF